MNINELEFLYERDGARFKVDISHGSVFVRMESILMNYVEMGEDNEVSWDIVYSIHNVVYDELNMEGISLVSADPYLVEKYVNKVFEEYYEYQKKWDKWEKDRIKS